MTRLLIAAGCEGDGDHGQRWDNEEPQGDLIVLRRHAPHGRPPSWAKTGNIIQSLQIIDYSVFVVIMSRDWHATIQSQLAAPHVTTWDEGLELCRNAWRAIITYLPCDVPFEVVSYEALTQRPFEMVLKLYDRLGLEYQGETEYIFDGNVKYYREAAVV
jgi:hypothetical protein